MGVHLRVGPPHPLPQGRVLGVVSESLLDLLLDYFKFSKFISDLVLEGRLGPEELRGVQQAGLLQGLQ